MALARKVKQLVVITPNEVGTLEKVCSAIREAGGGITHVCASTLGEDARFMMTVHEPAKVRAALEAMEYEVSEAEAVEIELDNVTGSLEPVAARLAAADVDKLQQILADAGARYKLADPTSWPKQAELAAAGKWAELEDFQDKLHGGRHHQG